MEGLVVVIAVGLIIAYIVSAICSINKCKTIGGSIMAAAAFLCGGLVLIPVVEAMTSFIVCIIMIIIILAIFGAVS